MAQSISCTVVLHQRLGGHKLQILGTTSFKLCLCHTNQPAHCVVEAGHQSSDGPFPSSRVVVAVDTHDHQMLKLQKREHQVSRAVCFYPFFNL